MEYFSFDALVRDYTHPWFTFCQVGANDGVTDDPIRAYVLEFAWRGLLIEPLPDVFERLKQNYGGNSKLTFLNAAVVEEEGPVVFYRHPTMPQCSGLGVVTRLQKRVEMERVVVRGLALRGILEGYVGSGGLDLLQVDTEGFDAEVVRAIPWGVVEPRIVRYEHKHLHNDVRQELHELLALRGYRVFWEGPDTVGYRPKA